MATIPSPVAELSGDTNNPIDWRTPMVIIRIAAAASKSGQVEMRTAAVDVSFIPALHPRGESKADTDRSGHAGWSDHARRSWRSPRPVPGANKFAPLEIALRQAP